MSEPFEAQGKLKVRPAKGEARSRARAGKKRDAAFGLGALKATPLQRQEKAGTFRHGSESAIGFAPLRIGASGMRRLFLGAIAEKVRKGLYNGLDALNVLYYESSWDCALVLDGCGGVRYGLHAAGARGFDE